ncbi:NAD(P)/FAD-dependent oxidoreductase [Mycobacterium sp. UM_CSW]|uniref:flavin-containing monooxygenase n=1 Tax=Mycobacterium sp. UM_CSW TaxID=1370119 RepID=UPI000415534E|nr:NAD(P)/FAD-dependent oxidoreductase [Mycobacterium sp. UM_CSW]
MSQRHPSVGIIGAGMSGICQAILLRQAGVTDVTIYEKGADVGGTWRDNTYPGLACDVPSRHYQFTFAMNPSWTRLFPTGPEIHEYFRALTERYHLNDNIRFRTDIVDARFADGRWHLTTGTGEQASHDFLIAATGLLRELHTPAIKGLADFDGPVMHSARWDHSVDMTGKRVAVVGTGSTGVQIVCGLVDSAARLDVFQRSPQWILPVPNPRYFRWMHPVRRRVPRLSAMAYHGYDFAVGQVSAAILKPGWRRRLINGVCRANLRTVRDPELRRRLTPDFQPMCRRLIISSGYYPAMQRDNVHLVDSGIDHVERRGIVTADGELRELDAIVLATGFDAHAFMRPMSLVGRDGLTLEQLWAQGPRAHLAVAMPGFPNFFMLMGPHSPFGNYSLTAIAEAQANHITGWITRWRTGEFDTVAPSRRATDDFNASMRRAMPGTVWTTGCNSWYLGADGVPELWPWSPREYRQRMAATPDINDYDIDVLARTA